MLICFYSLDVSNSFHRISWCFVGLLSRFSVLLAVSRPLPVVIPSPETSKHLHCRRRDEAPGSFSAASNLCGPSGSKPKVSWMVFDGFSVVFDGF